MVVATIDLTRPVTPGPRLAYTRPKFLGEPYLGVRPSTVPWLVKGVLPASGVAFLVGASKAGKSFLAIDMALRIASGAKVLGKTTRQTGVAYIGAEDAAGCRGRIAAWRQRFRRENDAPFDFYGDSVNLLSVDDVDFLGDSLEQSTERFNALGFPLGLIVIDTLSRCIPGVDENNSQQMSQAFVQLQVLGIRTDALILVLAHFGKAGEERGIRGWSGMDANSDATITLERHKDDQELRTLTLAKVKNGRDGASTSFRLADVDLGIKDDDGESLTSCVVEFEMNPPAKDARARKKAMNPAEKLVFEAITYLTDHGHTQPPPPGIPGVKPWTKGVRRGDVTIQLSSGAFAYEGEHYDATRKRRDRALQGLVSQGRVRMEGELIWLV